LVASSARASVFAAAAAMNASDRKTMEEKEAKLQYKSFFFSLVLLLAGAAQTIEARTAQTLHGTAAIWAFAKQFRVLYLEQAITPRQLISSTERKTHSSFFCSSRRSLFAADKPRTIEPATTATTALA
jgi:hypothetical protein